MKRTTSALIAALALGVFLPGLLAQAATSESTFALINFEHHADGPDRVFNLEVQNVSEQNTYLRGRLVVLSVYDTAQPTVIPIEDVYVGSHNVHDLEIRWAGAPIAGRMRAMLVLSGGTGATLVKTYDYWLLSSDTVNWAVGVAMAAVLALIFMKRLRRHKSPQHAPTNMVDYRVEFDDTVMTISNRYGVTWQDLVHANRLKPPYDLKPGQRLVIPRHPLVRPPETEIKPKP